MQIETVRPNFEVQEAIILAGGLGTRLRAVVNDVPKPMAPVAGRPFLDYLLQYLETQGIRRVILSVGYGHEAISNFFGRRHGNLHLEYAVETEALGTGGGIRLALQLAEQPFVFALNGDTFLRLDYRAMSQLLDHPGWELAVALRTVENAHRYGRALLSGNRIVAFSAAGATGPGLINAGVYLASRDLFQRYEMPARFSFEADFLEPRVGEVRPLGFVCDGEFIDIGVPESYQESQRLLPVWTGIVETVDPSWR